MKKITNKPRLIDAMDSFREHLFSTLNCHAIGKIESFNSLTQRANISVMYSRKTTNDADTQAREDYPTIFDAPVMVASGGKGSLRFPISEGDFCLVLFNDRDIDNFLESGAFSQLNSDRKHSFSDGIAIVGLFPSSSPLSDYSDSKTELIHDKTKISMGDRVKISNSTKSLFTIIDALLTVLSTAQGVDVSTSAVVTLATINAAATQAKTDLALLME